MPAKRSKAVKVARKAKKKTPAKMKTKKPARPKPVKKPAKKLAKKTAPEPAEPLEEAVENEKEKVDLVDLLPKTRLEMIRYRHNAMKKEIDEIRAALEEERDE